jgi:DNA polymerase III delta prime subunit
MQPREFFVWVERYRPQTLADCILPSSVRHSLQGILDNQDTPNLLLCGKAGTGKTTVARCLAADLQMDVLMINASDENGIDVLRSKLKDFASTMSFEGKRKMIILDEADYLHPTSTQPALRAFMEEFSATTCFVLTCNHPNRIIAPLHSRCSVVDFSVPKADRPSVMTQFAKRAFQILDLEGITYDKQLVMEVLRVHFPDFRRTLNEMQRFSGGKELSREILSQLSDKDVAELFTTLAARDFNRLRKWISQHDDMNESVFYRMLSDQLPARLDPAHIPEGIIMLADYSYRVSFAADKSLNMLACLTEIMGGLQVKA